MLNFYPEEVAETLEQLAEIAGQHGNVHVRKKCLRDMAKKLAGGKPRPELTDVDWVYRERLEAIIIQGRIFWFKPKTIDYSVWVHLYDMGWRKPRWPLPAIIPGVSYQN